MFIKHNESEIGQVRYAMNSLHFSAVKRLNQDTIYPHSQIVTQNFE